MCGGFDKFRSELDENVSAICYLTTCGNEETLKIHLCEIYIRVLKTSSVDSLLPNVITFIMQYNSWSCDYDTAPSVSVCE